MRKWAVIAGGVAVAVFAGVPLLDFFWSWWDLFRPTDQGFWAGIIIGILVGWYLTGFVFTLYALWDQPWPDRIVIAIFWFIAAIRNLLFD